jgi:hypothetical protein
VLAEDIRGHPGPGSHVRQHDGGHIAPWIEERDGREAGHRPAMLKVAGLGVDDPVERDANV